MSGLAPDPNQVYPEYCSNIRDSFSGYLDGAVSGHEMQTIAAHLEGCTACGQEFEEWKAMQRTLASLKTPKAPEDLGLRLRLAISREQAARQSSWRDSVSLLWENTLRPLSVKAFGRRGVRGDPDGGDRVAAGRGASAERGSGQRRAAGCDYGSALFVLGGDTASDRTLGQGWRLREYDRGRGAGEQPGGRVYDYNMLTPPDGPQAGAIQEQIVDQLLVSVFKPASVFGVPVKGRVVLTFAGVSVRG